MRKEKMGAILGVSRGSAQEAQFIIVEYFGADKKEKPYVIIGKGITFDSGGISIKPSPLMDEMKYDMSGGSVVVGIIRAVSMLKLPINLVALIPASENMPGHDAYKPGDVLIAKDGTSIEVLNTDAEGRLLLADALVYARKYNPKVIVDLATLTGACLMALYDSAAGMFTRHQDLVKEFEVAGKKNGDMAWQLPMPKEYKELLKSNVADIANIASVPYGGAMTAAVFLSHFVKENVPWVHLDIAGVSWNNKGKKYLAPGSTGAGIRLVIEWLRQQL